MKSRVCRLHTLANCSLDSPNLLVPPTGCVKPAHDHKLATSPVASQQLQKRLTGGRQEHGMSAALLPP